MERKHIALAIFVLVVGGFPHISTAKESYLSDIPDKPADWDILMREANSGYVDFTEMGSAYWLQPDFYQSKIPGTDRTTWDTARPCYEEHDYSRWGVYGYGGFPSQPEFTFETREVGSWLSENILFRTGYCIETWQGVRLVPRENEYFNVKLSPEIWLLEPTFPKFSSKWANLLNIRVEIKEKPGNIIDRIASFFKHLFGYAEEIPPGEYLIPVEVGPPPREYSEKWFWEVLRSEALPGEQDRIALARAQAEKEGKLPEEFERWITLERKNKYVESTMFQMSPPIVVKVTVK